MNNNLSALFDLCQQLPQQVKIMEICGTHTQALAKLGLHGYLPNVTLLSGPGCPVCVTDDDYLHHAIALAQRGQVILTFGDMLNIPCGQTSLEHQRGLGADIRVVYSPYQALKLAQEQPQNQFIWLAVGFETTLPLTAWLLQNIVHQGINNLKILNAHKNIPAILTHLLNQTVAIDALICPGHVATIIGSKPFSYISRQHSLPAVIAGFSAENIIYSLHQLILLLLKQEVKLLNCYPSAVKLEGNPLALKLITSVFTSSAVNWRGIGRVKASGYTAREGFSLLDEYIPCQSTSSKHKQSCLCGLVLQGIISPRQCPQWGKACSPIHPLGPCMVSQEGSCRALYENRRLVSV